MLVLSRQRNGSIVIGDHAHALVPLTPAELRLLGQLAAAHPDLAGAVNRMRVAAARPLEVRVEDIRGDSVRVGVDAPKYLPVHRKEVYDALRRQSRRAGVVDAPTPVGLKAADDVKAALAAVTAGGAQ